MAALVAELAPRGAAAAASHHLYVHVPFCRLVCAYCDFVTVAGRGTDIPRYVDALLAEMDARPAPGSLRTIYFGGGTPSLLDASHVARIIDASAARWSSVPSEVSLEANPSAREAPDWDGLRSAGVTRLSLGIQSLRDQELRTLARGHSAAEAVEAYNAARAARFEIVSIDLIYAIPGQDVRAWTDTLAAAVALAPDHISLYALSLALVPDEWAGRPRAGALRWRRDLAARQDDDHAASQYEIAEETLDRAGYTHYELSSWARPGHESQHNRAYWERRPYTGLGAGAHSFDGMVRSWNWRSLDGYLAAVERGDAAVAGSESLSLADAALETIALGLRTSRGVSRAAFRRGFGTDPVELYADAVALHRAAGTLDVDGDSLRLSRRGRLLANEVVQSFLVR